MAPTLSVDCLAKASFHNSKQLMYTQRIPFLSLINIKSWQRTITVTAIMRGSCLFFTTTIERSLKSNFLTDFFTIHKYKKYNNPPVVQQ